MEIEKLKELGFEPYKIQTAKPFVGKVIFRKKDFGFGWELDLPYVRQAKLYGLGSDIKLNSTLYKVIGDTKELIFKIPGNISSEFMEELIVNSISQ